MNQWPHKLSPTTREEIQQYTAEPDWQRFRLSLKGLPTTKKLEMLMLRRGGLLKVANELEGKHYMAVDSRNYLEIRHVVQISNYLLALKRGGFLDDNLTVIK